MDIQIAHIRGVILKFYYEEKVHFCVSAEGFLQFLNKPLKWPVTIV